MKNVDLYGVVLCGGRSSRMGRDKSLLKYHGVEQRYFLYRMLQQFCDRTFISYNAGQQAPPGEFYEAICDDATFAGNGPISGLMSAFHRFPSKEILLIGCDYPMLRADHIRDFLSGIPAHATAAAFYNKQENCYEPVLAWYSPAAGVLIDKYFYSGITSLQKILNKLNAYKVHCADPGSLQSIDTDAEYSAVAKHLADKNKTHNA